MAHLRHDPWSAVQPLNRGWELCSTAPDECATPAAAEELGGWLPASVPGTVAGALQAAGCWNLDAPVPLHDRDHWYRCRFAGSGAARLRFGGLATVAEVWLNGRELLQSDNMFLAHEADVDLAGDNRLHIRFKALAPILARPGKRARWRPALIAPPTLRSVRTTLLGHMPGWCPPVHAVGPWRAIELVSPSSAMRIEHADVRATLSADGSGDLRVQLRMQQPDDGAATLLCAGRSVRFTACSDGTLRARLTLPDVAPWWPHTHGTPALHEVTAHIGDRIVDLGRVGFRRIEVDCGDDGEGFALRVNGTRVFCRGACWAPAEPVTLDSSAATYAPWLQAMQAANMNMVRVGGTMLYEGNAFYELCDELGLLVWQDFMFANFDYPVGDPAFEASVRAEAAQFLDRTQASPSLAVLCGGSEVAQQAAMLGLPEKNWSNALFDQWLPAVAAAWRPDLPYVSNSPSGGELPFVADAGVTHYYGVGAYQRPLEDARRAEVRFASECLAFANVPQPRTLAAALPVAAVHHPLWKERVPRDPGAAWDFEDIRDHYLGLLYRVDPSRLRREEPERYLQLSRMVTGDVMESVFAEWRRRRSVTHGGLVWLLKDLLPGAGWGLIDALGEPKAAWYALRRTLRPLQVLLTDEGVNGTAVHLINETGTARPVRLSLSCWRGDARVISAERALQLPARETVEFAATALFGGFFDTNYAYRFGPPSHEMVHAVLHCAASGAVLAEAFQFPQGRRVDPRPLNLEATVTEDAGDWFLVLKTSRPALGVSIDDDGFRAEDNAFQLAPGDERRVRLLPRGGKAGARPDGEVRAANATEALRYRAAPNPEASG
jgi:beta-mannosidase